MAELLSQLSEEKFPFLFGGTFIEGGLVQVIGATFAAFISLPFRRDFH